MKKTADTLQAPEPDIRFLPMLRLPGVPETIRPDTIYLEPVSQGEPLAAWLVLREGTQPTAERALRWAFDSLAHGLLPADTVVGVLRVDRATSAMEIIKRSDTSGVRQ